MTQGFTKEERQRLFVAVELPDAVRRTLADLQKGLPGMRWASPDSLHLTVRFIGEVALARIAAIKAGLKSVQAEDFPLQINGLGFFSKRPQAVVWAGVATSTELAALKGHIDAALKHYAGLQAPTCRFSPHITLGKMKQADRKALQNFTSGNEAAFSATFPVCSFTLFSSVTAPGGAVHTAEARYNLGNV